jgi:hypothetical protein
MVKEYNNFEKFLNEVDNFSLAKGGRLKRKNDLKIILEETLKPHKEKLFEDLSFTAKYLQGLMRVLKKGGQNPEVKSLEYVKSDYSSNADKFIAQLKEVLSENSMEVKEHFNKTYFELSQEAFHNLNELLSDLEWTKIYLNEQKRRN